MSDFTEKLERLNIYVPANMVAEIEERARDLNTRRGSYIRDLLSMGLEVERDNEVRGAL